MAIRVEKKEGEGEREKRGREENRFESNETAGDGGKKRNEKESHAIRAEKV